MIRVFNFVFLVAWFGFFAVYIAKVGFVFKTEKLPRLPRWFYLAFAAVSFLIVGTNILEPFKGSPVSVFAVISNTLYGLMMLGYWYMHGKTYPREKPKNLGASGIERFEIVEDKPKR